VTELLTAENLVALLTLTLLEIVLGIDNIVFISILTGKLPPAKRPRAWRIGLSLAMLMRIGLLLAISWVISLTAPLVTLFGSPISGRDLILIGGGLFLLAKATWEIHDNLEGGGRHGPTRANASFALVIAQIVALDMVFSLDSVITAVGMTRVLWVMITAVIVAITVMLVFAQAIGAFVERHPTIKMLALSFLILIGVLLVADGLGHHIPKGYVYFAMAFSIGVEMLNLRVRARAAPVELKRSSVPEPPAHAAG
jgi:predicted tellurium resistance membrane protein TerC